MTNDNDSNSSNNHPTNLVEFESQKVKHKFGLDKYPDISTEGLLVSLRDIVKSMDPPSYSQQTDCQYLSFTILGVDVCRIAWYENTGFV
jgi:hypothetical protein